MLKLSGKVAIITGGARGIGKSTAVRLARDGARVVIADILKQEGEQAADEIRQSGGEAIFFLADVSRHEDIRALVQGAQSSFGGVDIVVNSAYWSVHKSVVDLSEEEWDKGMNTVAKAVFLTGKYAFPIMKARGGGAFVNVSSVHGHLCRPDYPVYAAAKAAVNNLTRQMAIDGGPLGIRVNCVSPGTVKVPPASSSRSARELFDPGVPLQRVGRPEEIASVIRFLVGEESSFMTGQNLVVDGGLSIQIQNVGFPLRTAALSAPNSRWKRARNALKSLLRHSFRSRQNPGA